MFEKDIDLVDTCTKYSEPRGFWMHGGERQRQAKQKKKKKKAI